MANYNTPSRLFKFNDVPPSEGLIAAWNLSTVNDSFSTNNLTNNNSVTFVAGKINNCASFDGVSKYLSIASNSSLNYGGGKKLSLCFWFKLNALPSAGNTCRIIGKWVSANQQSYLVTVSNTGVIAFSLSSTGANSSILSSGVGVISINVWYFVCVWYDGVNQYLELNANGSIFSQAYSSDIFSSSSILAIGGDNTANKWVNGFVDAVRLYKHDTRVLTATERLVLYNLGLGREFISSNVISSFEVNSELNQIINILNGTTNDITPKINVNSVDAGLTINQQGNGPVLQCYNGLTLKAEINNQGQFVSKLATGIAPITIASAATTVIPNLNVDLLDGLNASDFLQVNQVLNFCDSVNHIGSLVAVDKHTGIGGTFVTGIKIYCRTLPSSDALITFGIYKQTGELLGTCTLNNTLNLNTFSIAPVNLEHSRLLIKVLLMIGSVMPSDVSVGIISKKVYI